jgi:GDSL-like Lipase/Acylhydrolase family
MKKAPRAPARSAAKKPRVRRRAVQPSLAGGPVTLAQAQAIARATSLAPAKLAVAAAPTPATVGMQRKRLALAQRAEIRRRVAEYKATLQIMKKRGVVGLAPASAIAAPGMLTAGAAPLQVFAEGDSWFDYPYPLFGGSIIKRLEKRLGVPILNLAQAGDETRFMLGVEQRQRLAEMLRNGCPAGGNWDVLLFSGGGNDIVGNPMALWIDDWNAGIPIPNHLNTARFDHALAMVRAAYEDLIGLRDQLSPGTRLLFHTYDYAIPDGRPACHLGPWLKPTFDLRGFPNQSARFQVVQTMLQRFAAMLAQLAAAHVRVTLLPTQGTLAPTPSSWHNELHPSKKGFETFAGLFHGALTTLYPGRVP